MTRRLLALCAGAMIFFAGVAHAELPNPVPPFKPHEMKRQHYKLKVDRNICDEAGKTGDIPMFISANKCFCFNMRNNRPFFSQPGTFSVYMDTISRKYPALTIRPTIYIPGVGKAEGVGTTLKENLAIDEEKQTVTFSKSYFYTKDKMATFSCRVGNGDEGKLNLEWNCGLTPEQIKVLPKGSTFGITFQSTYNKHKDLGVSCDGEKLNLFSDKELKEGHKPKTFCDKTILRKKGAHITLYEKCPMSIISLDIDPGFDVHLYESMWYNPNALKPADITFVATMSRPMRSSGSMTIDLGETAVKESSTPPSVADIDFYGRDRMHLPKLPTRNLLSNPSFEQDLRYLRWYWGGGDGDGLSSIPSYCISNDAKFGKKSLKLQMSARGNQALHSFPIPVVPGKTYTLSFYAKGAKKGDRLNLKIINALTNYTSQYNLSSQPSYDLTADWKRYSFTFKADTRAMTVHISKQTRGPIFIDGLQLELGDKTTEFVSPVVEGILRTTDPDNMINKNDKIQASFALTGKPGAKGSVNIKVKDFYDKVLFDHTYDFKLDDHGDALLQLPFDQENFGEGIFVVRADYFVDGNSYYTDYYRYSKMKFLNNTHASKNMFNNQLSIRYSRREDLARNYKRWGMGSICAQCYPHGIKTKRELCERNNIDLSFGVVFEIGRFEDKYKNNSYALMRRNPWRETVEPWMEITPERAKWIEDATYEIVKKYPFITTWAPMGETECRWEELRKGDFTQWAKMAKAFYKGAKRANPKVKLLGCQGPAGFLPAMNRGIEEVKGVMKSVQGEIKWDAIATHPYFSTDGVSGRGDLDTNIIFLMNLMKEYGYDDTPICFPEGGNMTSMSIPEWDSHRSQDSYKAGRASYDSSWKEFYQAALHARRFLISFKYWPRVQYMNMWTSAPFIDYYLTPLYMCKVVNTLGQLFENPKYVADIKPLKSIRGYAFTDHKDRGLIAIWATEDKVDIGMERGAELLVKFPGKLPQFIDLMGNERNVDDENGAVRILLSSAPLFIRGEPGKVQELIRAFREAKIIGAKNVMTLNALPSDKGVVDAVITNLVDRALSGTITVDDSSIPIELAASKRVAVPLSEPVKPEFGVMYNWRKNLAVRIGQDDSFNCERDLAYFYVPHVEKPLPLEPDAKEWDKIPAFTMNNWRGKQNEKFGYEGDMSASYQAAWDKEALYLRIVIKDDQYAETKKYGHKELYEFDNCVEVYFDTGANARASSNERGYDGDDYRYDFAAISDDGDITSGRAQVYRLREAYHQLAGGIEMPSREQVMKELRSRFKRTKEGCVYVIRFDQAYLEPFMLKKGSISGFALYIHDKEPGEKWPEKGLSSSSKSGQHCDYYPKYWPLMVLHE